MNINICTVENLKCTIHLVTYTLIHFVLKHVVGLKVLKLVGLIETIFIAIFLGYVVNIYMIRFKLSHNCLYFYTFIAHYVNII